MPSALTNIEQQTIDRIERLTLVGHWTLDVETASLFWSEQTFLIHGLSPDTYTPEVETAINCFVEEDREYVTQCVETAIAKGESYVFECRLKRGDGQIRTTLARGECEKDETGKTTRVFGTIQDITELKQEQERYEMALAASHTAIWDWDIITNEITWYGASHEVLCFEKKEDLPKTSNDFFNDLLVGNGQSILKQSFTEHFKTREEFQVELQIKCGQADTMWMLACGQAQWSKDGKAIRMIGSLTQIDELKEMQTKLMRSNDDLDQFASIAAHDLQGPLRTISGFLEILKEKHAPKLDDEANEYISFAVKGAENMSELISDLLEYSRLETDGLKRVETDSTKIIQSALRHLQANINESRAIVKFEDMPTIPCDPNKLQRVFYNLIENAMKYRGERPPKITITCEKGPAGWHFVIKDNGIGMQSDKLDKIFQMFQRLHNKNKYSGTGIGLSICKKVIEMHEGNIWAESKIGEGTSFHFIIPDANLNEPKDA